MISTPSRIVPLRHNFLWALLGNGIYGACHWAMLIVLAKLTNAETLGQFALALAIVTPVILYTNLQLRHIQATDARNEFPFHDYLRLRILTVGLALGIIAVILIVGDFKLTTALIVLGVAITKVFNSLSDIIYGLFQRYERMDRISISMMAQSLLQLAALGFIIFFTQNLLFAVLVMAFISALVLLFYDFHNAHLILGASEEHALGPGISISAASFGISNRWNIRKLYKLTWLGLPVGLVMGTNTLIAAIPRYLTASHLGEADLGILVAMFYLTIIGAQVVGALSDSAMPRLAMWFSGGNYQAFRNLLGKLIAISLFLGGMGLFAAVIAGKQILTTLYQPEYANHTESFIWLMASLAPEYIAGVLGVAVTSMRRFHIQVPFRFMHLAFMYALSTYLIPKYGLNGAAKTIFISSVFFALSTATLVFICIRWHYK